MGTQEDHQSSNAHMEAAGPEVNKNEELKTISKYRKALPQFLATSAMYLNLFNMGMSLGFPTIMLPAVQKGMESVVFDEDQASWFASLMFIFQPVGSLFSSLLVNYFGRKNSLILINIPYFIIWITVHLSESIPILMISSIVLAINIGFLEPPAINYVGEISTPKLRGILTSYSAPIIYLGVIFEFILGKLYHWRTVALINSTIPVITIAFMTQIPESPMWLLSKGKSDKAKSALCWLRGWVKPEYVAKEFKYLLNYKEESSGYHTDEENADKVYTIEITKNSLSDMSTPDYKKSGSLGNINRVLGMNGGNCPEVLYRYKGEHDLGGYDAGCMTKAVKFYNVYLMEHKEFNTLPNKKATSDWKIMLQPEYVRPFFLLSMYFLFYYMSGISSIRPYLMLVIEEMRIPVDPKLCAIFVPVTGFLGSIVSMCVIKKIGKRPLSLISIGGSALGALACGVISYRSDSEESQLMPFIMFLFLAFFTSLGIASIPWMLLSEVFPLRGRGVASGMAAAVAYALGFGTAKTFLDLRKWFGLHGVFFLYGSCSLIGLFYFYLCLPETEGKTLQEIEQYFKENKSKKENKDYLKNPV